MWDESQLYHNSLPVHKQHEVLSLQSQIEAITNEIAILQVCLFIIQYLFTFTVVSLQIKKCELFEDEGTWRIF